jgi:hypothetical protein
MRPLLAALLILLGTTAAAQQQFLRAIPAEAKRGVMSHVHDTIVEIDGKRARLSQGAQIRGQMNSIVLPTALPPKSLVRFQVDQAGHVHRVWILTPQEAARKDGS